MNDASYIQKTVVHAHHTSLTSLAPFPMHRSGVIQAIRYVPVDLRRLPKIGHPHTPSSNEKNRDARKANNVAGILFAACLFGYAATAAFCLVFCPLAASSAGGAEIPPSATCLRATRHADYATVSVGVGTPVTQMSLLLRLDSVLSSNDNATHSMRVFSQEVVESDTIACGTDGRCEDAVLVSRQGVDGAFEYVVASFSYTHAAVEEASGSVAYDLPRVEGELRLREGYIYWLTSTHFCYEASSVAAQPLASTVQANVSSSGKLQVERSSLVSFSSHRDSPLIDKDYLNLCPESTFGSKVDVFPILAGIESRWLSISDSSLYNSEPESVNARRTIAELGVGCAAQISSLARDLVLYNLDCQPYGACRSSQSLPFRRLATSSIYIDLSTTHTARISADSDASLSDLPQLANSNSAFLLSLVKLALITLAAAVVYARSKRPTASSSWLFRHCLISASIDGYLPDDDEFAATVVEDKILGFVAVASRAAIAYYRLQNGLGASGYTRVVISEMAASAISFVHWILRYEVETSNTMQGPPITKLGGPTAILDATSAVMMAFASSPLLVTTIANFDPTARMLIAILISIVVVTRCAFASACCAILWEAERYTVSLQLESNILFYSAVAWITQACLLGILVADLFVTPAAYSMSRSVVGDLLPARLLLFSALVGAGLPRLTKTLRNINEDKVGKTD